MARCGTCADATWQARPRGSATRIHASTCMAQWWCGRVARPRESTRTPEWHLRGMQSNGLVGDGPTGIVGPSYSIGLVTHLRSIAPPFILANSVYFLCVGLCSLLISSLQDTWQNNVRRMKSRGLRSVNQVNSGRLDRHQAHVR